MPTSTALIPSKPPSLPPITKFEAYARAVNEIPTMDPQREIELAQAVQSTNDRAAALELITSHLRLSVKVARENRGYGIPLEDLTQEGNIGLMKAVKRFDPTRGVRLSVVALSWIRATIGAYVLANWRLVKVATTKALRTLFFSFRSEQHKLEQLGVASSEMDRLLADKLQIPIEAVREASMRFSREVSLDVDGDNEDDGSLLDTLHATNEDAYDTYDASKASHGLSIALESLPERTMQIIQRRHLDDPPSTLAELSSEFGVSIGRVAQIEAQGLKALKHNLLTTTVTPTPLQRVYDPHP
jgi:RNA polymerase sigma-32 factor